MSSLSETLFTKKISEKNKRRVIISNKTCFLYNISETFQCRTNKTAIRVF